MSRRLNGMKKTCLAVFVGMAWWTLAAAQPAPKVYGVGVQPCAEWVKGGAPGGEQIAGMEASLKQMAVIAWATGYLTGAAATLDAHGIVLRNTSGQDLVTWLTTYCQAHPPATIEHATAALVRTLTP